MKPTVVIHGDLEVTTQCKYSVPASGVPFFMVQYPTENGSLFQFRKCESFDIDLESKPVSTSMAIEDVEHLIKLMKAEKEHKPFLIFESVKSKDIVHHHIFTENEDEFILFFQLIEKYFYPICENWKSVHNMQRLQKKRELAKELDTETETEADSTTDSNE